MLHGTILGRGPRAHLLSKIRGALTALRTEEAGIKGGKALASSNCKAKQTIQLRTSPRQVQQSWHAAWRHMRKVGIAVHSVLLLQLLQHLAPPAPAPRSAILVLCPP